jgi:hypothetical protein
MDGTDKIGEIRGNSPQQALTQTQADIATTFIKDKNFKSGDKYLAEVDKKRALLALAKDKETIPFDTLMRFDKNVFTDKGEVKGSALNRLFRFDLLDGYGVGRPEMPNLVQTFFADRLLQSAKKAYENGYWIFSNFNSTDVEDRNAVDGNISSTARRSTSGVYRKTGGAHRRVISSSYIYAAASVAENCFVWHGKHTIVVVRHSGRKMHYKRACRRPNHLAHVSAGADRATKLSIYC